jgi:hypothetical protein
MQRLSVSAMALGFGLTWAVAVLSIGWTSTFGWGTRIVEVLSSLYVGYAPGFLGGTIGALWALVDGAIGGAIFALVYNAVVRRR